MIALIVQARTTSSRFPGKVLEDIGGKTMLAHVLERCRQARLQEEWVLAIPEDDPKISDLARLAHENGFNVLYGSRDDVLSRYFNAACIYRADLVVRITADCPLIDPELIDRVTAAAVHHRNAIHYATNTIMRVHPHGMDVEAISFKALEAAAEEAKDGYDREHVTTFIRRDPRRFPASDVGATSIQKEAFDPPWIAEHGPVRLTVDYLEDLEVVRAVYDGCKDKPHTNAHLGYKVFGISEIVEFVRAHPEVVKANQHRVRR